MLTQAQEIGLMVMAWMYLAAAPMLALMIWFREPKRIPNQFMSMAVTVGAWITVLWVPYCMFFGDSAIHVSQLVFWFPAAVAVKAVKLMGF